MRNYVGTAWEISDIGAVMFARTLYGAMLQPPRLSLGEALVRARTILLSEESAFGALWAAYQHYGDPAFGWPV